MPVTKVHAHGAIDRLEPVTSGRSKADTNSGDGSSRLQNCKNLEDLGGVILKMLKVLAIAVNLKTEGLLQ